jgi:predicted HicB family RNase H-like nuclease
MMADHYTYRVAWSEEDGEYVGACAEFPSLSHLDADQDAALRGVRRLVADVVADMAAKGEAIPVPLSERRYSGRFQTRVPPELHRALAIEAAEAGVSLNRLVSLRLALPVTAMLGPRPAARDAGGDADHSRLETNGEPN